MRIAFCACRSSSEHEALRIVITRGGRRLLLTDRFAPMPERARLASISYSPPLILDGVKSLSYAANMLASRIARERGFDDALLVEATDACWSFRPARSSG